MKVKIQRLSQGNLKISFIFFLKYQKMEYSSFKMQSERCKTNVTATVYKILYKKMLIWKPFNNRTDLQT